MEESIDCSVSLGFGLLGHYLGGNDLKGERDCGYEREDRVHGRSVPKALRPKEPRNDNVVGEVDCGCETRARQKHNASGDNARMESLRLWGQATHRVFKPPAHIARRAVFKLEL